MIPMEMDEFTVACLKGNPRFVIYERPSGIKFNEGSPLFLPANRIGEYLSVGERVSMQYIYTYSPRHKRVPFAESDLVCYAIARFRLEGKVIDSTVKTSMDFCILGSEDYFKQAMLFHEGALTEVEKENQFAILRKFDEGKQPALLLFWAGGLSKYSGV